MKLDEILDKVYPWSYTEKIQGHHYAAKFKTDGGSTVHVVTIIDVSGDTTIANVVFMRDHSQSLTGQGDAFKIFSTVVDIVRDTVKQTRPDVIVYAADKGEQSRVDLYDKMTRKYKPPGYMKIEKMDDIKDPHLKQDLKQWVYEVNGSVDSEEFALSILVRI